MDVAAIFVAVIAMAAEESAAGTTEPGAGAPAVEGPGDGSGADGEIAASVTPVDCTGAAVAAADEEVAGVCCRSFSSNS